MTTYFALLRSELRVSMRERSVLFFNYLFPMVFFFMFGEFMNARASLGSAQFIVSTVLAIGIMGNGFFGMGMRAVQERELGILRRLRLAPITPAPILLCIARVRRSDLSAVGDPHIGARESCLPHAGAAEPAVAGGIHRNRERGVPIDRIDHRLGGGLGSGSANPHPDTLPPDVVHERNHISRSEPPKMDTNHLGLHARNLSEIRDAGHHSKW
jgi:hypothetical protein